MSTSRSVITVIIGKESTVSRADVLVERNGSGFANSHYQPVTTHAEQERNPGCLLAGGFESFLDIKEMKGGGMMLYCGTLPFSRVGVTHLCLIFVLILLMKCNDYQF